MTRPKIFKNKKSKKMEEKCDQKSDGSSKKKENKQV